jgi:hypothetical protein
MDSIHVKCRNLLKRTWSDYQNLKKFLGAKPDESSAKAMAAFFAREKVDPAIEGKLGKGKKEAEELLDRFFSKYEWEELGKKGPDPKTMDLAQDSSYLEYKGAMDREYPKAMKEVLDTEIFQSLKGQPCGAVSNIMSSMFLGESLIDWKTKDHFGKAHVTDVARTTTMLGTVKRVPTWVFVRVEAVDFGHSYTYVGHPDDDSKPTNERRIKGIIYQSNMHQTLGDAMFSLGTWVGSLKFEAEVDLEQHLTALRSYKNKDISKVMEFVDTYYMANGLHPPEETKKAVEKSHGDKLKPPEIWLIIRPMSQVTLEENYRKYVTNVIPLVEAVSESLV